LRRSLGCYPLIAFKLATPSGQAAQSLLPNGRWRMRRADQLWGKME